MKEIDIAANRATKKYSLKENFKRILWGICKPAYKYSPRPFFGWRSLMLTMFGANVGENVHVYPSAIIYMPWNLTIGKDSSIGEFAYIYNLGKISIGNCVTISQRVHLCAGTHDYNSAELPLIKLPVVVEDSAWICADAFVGPGVKIGKGSVIGARAVVMKDVGDWDVMVGNPAKKIKTRNIA